MLEFIEPGCDDYASLEDTTGFAPVRLAEDRPDRHIAVASGSRVLARCSLWWRDTPTAEDQRVGVIGHYAATDDTAAQSLLACASRALAKQRRTLAIGPMDGNSWRSYRFVTDSGGAPAFFLEPVNPVAWPEQFRRAGFRTVTRYVSELNPNFHDRQPPVGELPARFRADGVRVERLDPDQPDRALDGIHEVALAAFARSPWFTPLGYGDFRRLYAPLLERIDPELALVAWRGERVVGFIFAPPDYLQAARGEAIDTIVIKTVAIRPEARWRGLGRVLIVALLQNAQRLGYRQAVSALMHTGNRSQVISRGCAGPMRAYALYGKALAP